MGPDIKGESLADLIAAEIAIPTIVYDGARTDTRRAGCELVAFEGIESVEA
jgi:hypothetical protein